MDPSNELTRFLDENSQVVCAELTRVSGSSPRDAGTFMIITENEIWNTIGGGQLEFRVIKAAREMLQAHILRNQLDLVLGPETGQCCGGRVEIKLYQPTRSDREKLIESVKMTISNLPRLYIFGAGHVGREICNLAQHMPIRTFLVDERENELGKCHARVNPVNIVLPERIVHEAPAGSAAVIVTHAHALDFLIAHEALETDKFSYVGMIGSKTKRASFKSWHRKHTGHCKIDQLVCPMGSFGSPDKRPSVIASFILAEVMGVLSMQHMHSEIQPDHHKTFLHKPPKPGIIRS